MTSIANQDLTHFAATQTWLATEFKKLRAQKRTPRNRAQLRELAVRARALNHEVATWIQRNS
jgi:hypothetical protein